MLDTATKHRIDTARNILVGKVPDPKSQVEQITIALIYKFMDDMDAEAEELGGARTFFSGDFDKFGWSKLLHAGLGGHEMLALYSTAIDSMTKNPGVPQLFRDIFKNAYLPYKDPETLRAFLTIIDEFTYDHSERLGDAFEYLLSVLGSQGDAGMFRTPRHIIDFMIEVVDPQKHESVLDPACGTAGFLISAYKHILRANTDKHGTNTLTPDEREVIARNFIGYDISPDMVRLSLVNLYLHGFTQPRIYEYDTLTSQERWNDYADVILANPPFMSPKGGIKPHNRFSVQSKRSEVLFVDYMAEHLKPTGRAAIIVPEGIIFQSQTAYKQLRKMLVEDSLVAVVSLPAGVFNPYSGVKTSILILDKALAQRTDSIAFLKIENDGFGLGAQRRVSEKNDLPAAAAFLADYFQAIREQSSTIRNHLAAEPAAAYASSATHDLLDRSDLPDLFPVASPTHCHIVPKVKNAAASSVTHDLPDPADLADLSPVASPTHCHIVPKAKIAANGEYNLSGERYVEGAALSSNYPSFTLGEVCNIFTGSTPSKQNPKYWENKKIPWFTVDDIRKNGRIIRGTEKGVTELALKETSVKLLPVHSVLLCCTASVGEYAFTEVETTTNQQFNGLVVKQEFLERLFPKFLFFVASQFKEELIRLSGKTSFNFVSVTTLKTLQIPLPPLDIQKQIVAEIEGYQKIIDGARAIVDNYRPHIDIDPSWPVVELDRLAKLEYGFTASAADAGDARFIRITDIAPDGSLRPADLKFISLTEEARQSLLSKGDVLVARTGATYGKTMLFTEDYSAVFASYLIRLRFPKSRVNPRYYWVFAQSDNYWSQANALMTGGGQPQFNGNALRQIKLPLPPLDTQQSIVAEIEKEQALVTSTRELITRFEKKIQMVLAKVWGE